MRRRLLGLAMGGILLAACDGKPVHHKNRAGGGAVTDATLKPPVTGKVAGLTAVLDGPQVRLAWQPVAGAYSYEIYQVGS